jgi:Skp family chaperone for outer membrane proteins
MVKKIIICVSCLILVSSCSNREEVKNENTMTTVSSRKLGELKIAYYVQDSMKLHFKYYKEQDSIFSKRQLAFQSQIAEKRKQMESYYMNFMKRVQNNELSQVESEGYQRNLQNQEAELIKFQEQEGGTLEQETLKKFEEVSKKIEKFSEEFCKMNNIDLLIIHAPGGQFNYISSEMNVTEEFVAFLNKSQQEIENDIKK